MTRTRWTRVGLTSVVLLVCVTFSTGCNPANWFSGGASVNVIVPMGLAGSPGLLNPFGIVQAIVNAALGLTATGEEAATYALPSSSTDATIAAIAS